MRGKEEKKDGGKEGREEKGIAAGEGEKKDMTSQCSDNMLR